MTYWSDKANQKKPRQAALCIVILVGFSIGLMAQAVRSHHAESATVPMRIEDNRIFVPLRVSGPNGRSEVVRFWVDSGGDAVFLSGVVARDLGLGASGAPFTAMGNTPSHAIAKPRLAIGGMKIDLTHVPVNAPLSKKSRDVFAGVAAGGFLPATVLSHYDVVFDYPDRSFTLARSGHLVHRGTPVSVSVQSTTGFARIDITVDGQAYGFMLDTGAAYTGLSLAVMDHWIRDHPSWPHSVGAVGAANMVGKQFDVTNELLRVPEMRWGPIQLRNVGMVSRPTEVYEKFVSKDMTGPIVGALAGNVLRQFRLDLDYPAGVAYLQPSGSNGASDLNCVGLIVQVKEDGVAVVSGVAQRNGYPEIRGVQAGDVLLRIGNHKVAGASLATILKYLSGTPGEKKHLTIRRGTVDLSVSATVFSHP
jgi:hypothetical protein